MASKPRVMVPANGVRGHAPQVEDTAGKDHAQERENTVTAHDLTQGTVNTSATVVRGRGGQQNAELLSVRETTRGLTAENGSTTVPVNVTERGTGIVRGESCYAICSWLQPLKGNNIKYTTCRQTST